MPLGVPTFQPTTPVQRRAGSGGNAPTTGGYGPDGTYYPGGGATIGGNPWAGAGSAGAQGDGGTGGYRGSSGPAAPPITRVGGQHNPDMLIPNSGGQPGGSATNASAMSDWLQAQANAIMGSSGAAQDTALKQYLYQQAYNDQSRQHITGTYNNDLGMLGESQYRDVTLARQGLGEDRLHLGNVWGQLQGDIKNRRGTTDRTLEIQKWLNDRNNIFNRQNLGIQRGQLNLTHDRNSYGLQSDATARGAVGSRGHLIGQRNEFKDWRLGLQGATLGFNRENASLRSQRDMDLNNYQAAINALNNQFNVGSEDYRHGIAGLDLQGQGLDSLGRTYGYRRDQLGLDRNQAYNENAYNGNSAYANYQSQKNQAAYQALMQILGLGQTGLGL